MRMRRRTELMFQVATETGIGGAERGAAREAYAAGSIAV